MKERQPELTVFFGPMFSGKTGALIDEMERQGHVNRKSLLVKPSNDTRYHPDHVVAHSGREIDAFPIDKDDPGKILQLIESKEQQGEIYDIVGIDEAQFFHPDIVDIIRALLETGKTVVVAGLPTDFRDEPFGSLPAILSLADRIYQKEALCTYKFPDGTKCGSSATKTQRIVNGEPASYTDPVVLVGGADLYEARCRAHHEVPGKPQRPK